MNLPPSLAMGLATMLLITGCERRGEADALLVDYQQQLAEALQLPAPEPQSPENIAAFPDRRRLTFDIPETRESLQNVYGLRQCNITSLVAERNTQLGRVAVPSQHWLYELELWRRLSGCLDSDIGASLAPTHRERLERLSEMKTRQLPFVSWNALFGSSEWRASFSRASRPLSPGNLPDIEPFLAALDYLREGALRQFDRDWRPDSATLSDHLQALRREPLTARVLRTLQLASLRLTEANRLLETERLGPLVCPETELFQAMPVDYLDAIEAYAERWLTSVDTLLEAHPISLPAMDRYRQEWLSLERAQAPWQRFVHARQEHQRLLAQRRAECTLTTQPASASNET
ncbi:MULTISPECIES: DUF3080 family protein [Halomonadaceae]|uniref:DUF3080 family protein n=1 Tax=Halomonadaceae TaxID=28256 RepID=UPI00159929E9|nr:MULTISPECIES: DUF3080 family protein [Halomonas]QJQ93976.1 DUF3080 family protein [Halomonas sp. PA5]